jgi:predicted transcriptional regulator
MQERERLLASIAAGLADAESGRVMNSTELREQLRGWRADRNA